MPDSPESNKQLIRRWFAEVWNQQRAAAIDEMMDANMAVHGHNPPVRNRDDFHQLHKVFCAALPDVRITTEFVVAEGDIVVAHNRVEATHAGELFGLRPSGRRVNFSGISIARVRNGKFVEGWDQYNFLELYGQLDALEHISALRKSAPASR